MDVQERLLTIAGRDALFRPIEFERYVKPQVTRYPPNAIVLNPVHTLQQQRQAQRGAGGAASTDGLTSSGEDEEDDVHDGSRQNADHEDDDDPRNIDKSTLLCPDRALQLVMHLRWKTIRPMGVGLVNLGNTCFANSVLQCVSYTPGLAQYLADTYKARDSQLGAPFDFAYALGETIRQIHGGRAVAGKLDSSRSQAYRPGLIVSNLKALSTHFSLGRQSDAHEFIVQLLFAVQKSLLYRLVGSKKVSLRVAQTTALARICGGYLRSQVSWGRQDEIQQLLKAGKRQEAADLRMDLNGGGPVLDRMVSNTYDPTNILHVELAGHTLEHCLSKFCEAERLPGRCYHSPRDVPVVATKQLMVHIPPNVLLLHMKRFTPTGGKIGKYIQYPLLLDLTPFCVHGRDGKGHASHRAADGEDGPRSERYLYELNAVCVHEGSSINYGHYYAVVRASNGTWYECNDASVFPLSEEKALRQQAYMLFYSRVAAPSSKTTAASSSAAGTAFEKGNVHARAVKYRMPTGVDGLPRKDEVAGEGVGKELSEEQVAALLAARPAAGGGPTADSERAPEDGHRIPAAEAAETTARGTAAAGLSSRLVLKRRRDDLSTEDDTSSEEQGGEDVSVPSTTPSRKDAAPRAESSTAPALSAPRHSSSSSNSRLVQHSSTGQPAISNETRHHAIEQKQSDTRALGRAAVLALEERRQRVTPATVQRSASAPKFQQRIRDAMWELEMDKGRVKKVKKKPLDDGARDDDGNRVNRFQQRAKGRFDIRGRRLHE